LARIDAVRALVRRGFSEEQAIAAFEACPDAKSFKEIREYAFDHFKAPTESPFHIECKCMSIEFKEALVVGLMLLRASGEMAPLDAELYREELDLIPTCPRPKREVAPAVAQYVEDYYGR